MHIHRNDLFNNVGGGSIAAVCQNGDDIFGQTPTDGHGDGTGAHGNTCQDDLGLGPKVKSLVSAQNFTDGDMREAFTRFAALKEQGLEVNYSMLSGGLSPSAASSLGGIIARNSEITITEKDVLMHIENLLTAKLSQSEAGETSIEALSERMKILREKKK